MPEHTWALLLLGAIAGLLAGMFGIGGGVVIVPALTVLFGYELHQAVGTSLAVLIWPVGILAVLAYYRHGLIRVRYAALIAAGIVAGGVFGAEIALSLTGETLQRIYGVFMLYVGWRFSTPRQGWAEYRHPAKKPAPSTPLPPRTHWALLLGVGLLAGLAAGLFGIGGGLIVVPALVGPLRFDQKQAVGTSLGALLPPVGVGALVSYYNADQIDIAAALLIALTLVAGAFGGARIALGLPSSTVKRLYGVFLMLVSLRFLLQF